MVVEAMLKMGRMNCSGCARNITRVLQTLPTVEVVETDVPMKRVHIRYDADVVTSDEVSGVLGEAKYPVVEVANA